MGPWVLESELGEAGGESRGDERPSGVRWAQWGQRITGGAAGLRRRRPTLGSSPALMICFSQGSPDSLGV